MPSLSTTPRPRPTGYMPSTNGRAGKRKSVIYEKPEKDKKHFKDVILLPSPLIRNVPKGTVRDAIFENGLVLSCYELHTSYSEFVLRKELSEYFQKVFRKANKIDAAAHFNSESFSFVRALGSKIQIIGNNKDYINGQIIYSCAGPRDKPIYIRSNFNLAGKLDIEELNLPDMLSEDEDPLSPLSDNMEDFPEDDLRPCPSCGQQFNMDDLEEHANVCLDESATTSTQPASTQSESTQSAASTQSAPTQSAPTLSTPAPSTPTPSTPLPAGSILASTATVSPTPEPEGDSMPASYDSLVEALAASGLFIANTSDQDRGRRLVF